MLRNQDRDETRVARDGPQCYNRPFAVERSVSDMTPDDWLGASRGVPHFSEVP